ncbi:MAG: hypothetical protein HN576_00645 [Bacteriovoracaceae bacterium]|jgi:hypothetical protein|nr:hypothetical protein [Bacteriovoracaceae bacterium]
MKKLLVLTIVSLFSVAAFAATDCPEGQLTSEESTAYIEEHINGGSQAVPGQRPSCSEITPGCWSCFTYSTTPSHKKKKKD